MSGYAVRPPRVRREKPRVSAFISADFEKIVALKPDLVLTFSDLQADIAAELIRRNIAVHAFNQRDVAGIFDMIRTLGALVGASEKAEELAVSLEDRLDAVRERAAELPRTPARLFRGMGRADDLRPQMGVGADRGRGRDRGVPGARRATRTPRTASSSADAVIAAAPDIIIGSWCGKKFVPAKVAARPGFAQIPAVRDGALHEIKSALILQPGPGRADRRARRRWRASLRNGPRSAPPGSHDADGYAIRMATQPLHNGTRAMTTAHASSRPKSIQPDLLLVLFLIGFDVAARLLLHMRNVSPVAASALFAGICSAAVARAARSARGDGDRATC